MDLKRKLIAGVIALAVGNCFALPTSARADSDDWHHHDHHEWRWHHHDRDWDDHYRPGYRGQYLPPDGQGMISRRNPNFYWACDGDGHHCHWARRR
jgi:hypothetical protein